MCTIIFAIYNYCCNIIFSHSLLYEINATIFFNLVLIFILEKNGSWVERGLEGMNFGIPWNFVKEQVLHNFTKYFSEAWVSQIVHLNGKLLNLSNLLLSVPWQVIFKNFYSIKKWMMPEIIDKNTSEIMTLPNNLVLICRLQNHNAMSCSL